MFVETHLGDISWDTFVAAATLVLAGTTYVVARRTGQLAKDTKELAATTAADVEAQFRPVIVPTPWRVVYPGGNEAFYWVGDEDGVPRSFAITNVGKGPALRVRAHGRVNDGAPQEAVVADRVVAVGAEPVSVELVGVIQVIERVGRIVEVDYESANGDRWTSDILIEEGTSPRPAERWRISLQDVRRRSP